MSNPAAFAAFFLSGLSSLIFQLVWTRLLQHVFGSSSVAISSVVSVFMGGLALGAWLSGKIADRLRRPLLAYALAESAVGAWALLVPRLVRPEGWLAGVNAALHASLGADSIQFMVARFLCIVPILIAPTALMGSTLPLLARYSVGTDHSAAQAGSRVGALYAINTFGAVSGVLLAGFVLLPNIGVRFTNLTAVAVNFALAMLVLVVQLKESQAGSTPAPVGESRYPSALPPEGEGRGDRVKIHAQPRATLPARYIAALAFSVSGAVSLLYEVVWSRALISSIGASVYSFALILAAFLIGIALGSMALSGIVREEQKNITPMAIIAVVLSALVNVHMAVRGMAYHWLAATSLCAVFIGFTAWIAQRRMRRTFLFDDSAPRTTGEIGWGLAVLAVPVISGCVDLLFYSDRLSSIVLSAASCICVFLGLLLALSRSPMLLLSLLQLYIGGATLAADLWADRISLIFAGMVAPLYDSLPEHVHTVMLMMSLTASLCVLAPALGMGAMFPLTVRVWSSDGRRIGRDVGFIYTGNTIGSILGAWLPGFILMPILGMQLTLHIGIAVNLLLSLILLLVTPIGAEYGESGEAGESESGKPPRRARLAGARGKAAAVYLLAGLLPALIALLYVASNHPGSFLRWNLSRMTLGTFRLSLAKSALDEEGWGEPDMLFYRDGLSTTVSVERWGRHYMLKNNGKVDASSGDDMPTQIVVAGYPLLMHAKKAGDLDVAIVGVGSGVTVGSVLQFPVRSVEVIELERAVVDGSRFFSHVNHLSYNLKGYPYVRMPRLSIINDDARNYLAAVNKRYDVIISEPSNPWLAGVSDLFTSEHFRLAKRRLKPAGIYCQWVQLYEISPENVKIIYRTFAAHFKHVMVFSAEARSSDTVLLGSDSPLPVDLDRVANKLAGAEAAREMERADISSPYDVFARVLLASRAEVMQYTLLESRLKGGKWAYDPASTNAGPCRAAACRRITLPLNTDDNARIEFAAPKDLIGFERYSGYLQTIYAESWPYARISRYLSGFGKGDPAAVNYIRQALALIAHGRITEAKAFQALSIQAGKTPESERLIRTIALLTSRGAEPSFLPELLSSVEGAKPGVDRRLADALDAAARAIQRKSYDSALKAVEKIPEPLRISSGPEIRFLYAYLLFKTGDFSSTIDELEELVRTEESFVLKHPEMYYFLSLSQYAAQLFYKAVINMNMYVARRDIALQFGT